MFLETDIRRVRLKLDLEPNHHSIGGKPAYVRLFGFGAGADAIGKLHLGLRNLWPSSRRLVDAIRAQTLLAAAAYDNLAINRSFRFARRWDA